jgi:hypothetical protein
MYILQPIWGEIPYYFSVLTGPRDQIDAGPRRGEHPAVVIKRSHLPLQHLHHLQLEFCAGNPIGQPPKLGHARGREASYQPRPRPCGRARRWSPRRLPLRRRRLRSPPIRSTSPGSSSTSYPLGVRQLRLGGTGGTSGAPLSLASPTDWTRRRRLVAGSAAW